MDVDHMLQTWVELGMDRQTADEYGARLRQRGRDLDAIIDVAVALRHRRLCHEAIGLHREITVNGSFPSWRISAGASIQSPIP